LGLIKKIIITDARGYIFVSRNSIINEGDDSITLIEKSLHMIACADNLDLYIAERKKNILYVKYRKID
jgi:hypothetical protein